MGGGWWKWWRLYIFLYYLLRVLAYLMTWGGEAKIQSFWWGHLWMAPKRNNPYLCVQRKVCVCRCVHVWVNVYVYLNILYVGMCMYVQMYICTWVCACVNATCVWVWACVCKCICAPRVSLRVPDYNSNFPYKCNIMSYANGLVLSYFPIIKYI